MHFKNLSLVIVLYHGCFRVVNILHYRCLSVIYNNSISSFTELLEIDNSVSLHHTNIQVLATKLCKVINCLFYVGSRDCFKLNSMTASNTRNRYIFYSQLVSTVLHGTE